MTTHKLRATIAHGPKDMVGVYTREEREALIRRAGRGKVIVNCIWPPIRSRKFDYAAVFDDDEPNDDGQMMVGYGATEIEAIDDLLLDLEGKLP